MPLSSPSTPNGAHHRAPRQTRSRGVAALTVVMVIFFVMAMVAAYTNRNLVFEQRISANSYRSTRALEAADAGVEWTLALLNGGRIGANCAATAADPDTAPSDFRSRYLLPSPDVSRGEGGFAHPWGLVSADRVYPTCIIVANGVTRCACPVVGGGAEDIVVPDGPNEVPTAFRTTFLLFNDNESRGGAVQFSVRGCANPGTVDDGCIAQSGLVPVVDASVGVVVVAGLVRALPVPPLATLTAGGTITVNAPGQLQIGNSDTATGVTAHAGGVITVNAPATARFLGPPGSGSDGQLPDDLALRTLTTGATALAEEHWFRRMFGMDNASYRLQPAVVRLDCVAGCTRASLDNALRSNPRNPIHVTGNLDIDGNGPLGTAASPLMLIVTGTLNISATTTITGFVHAGSVSWTAAGQLVGAMATSGNFTTTAAVSMRYDRPTLDQIRLGYGSFVRAPGGWNITSEVFN